MKDSDSIGADLRAAGFQRTQRLWLTQEHYDLVMWLAEQDKVEVERILARSRWQRRND